MATCQAWVVPVSSIEQGMHHQEYRLVVASSNEQGHRYAIEEATTIKNQMKVPKGVKLGRVKRCESSLMVDLALSIKDEGTAYQMPSLDVTWRCLSCGCSYHAELPTELEAVERVLARYANGVG